MKLEIELNDDIIEQLGTAIAEKITGLLGMTAPQEAEKEEEDDLAGEADEPEPPAVTLTDVQDAIRAAAAGKTDKEKEANKAKVLAVLAKFKNKDDAKKKAARGTELAEADYAKFIEELKKAKK